MWNSEKENIWQDVKNTWNEQPQSKKINIQVAKLINELKGKVGQFEKESINSDIATLKLNWAKTKRNNVSQFEKDSIKKDFNIISKFIKKVIYRFKR